MVGSIHVYGGFRLSSALARRVQRAVEEIVGENTVPELSHVDENCNLCRTQEEGGRVAPEPDRAGRLWTT